MREGEEKNRWEKGGGKKGKRSRKRLLREGEEKNRYGERVGGGGGEERGRERGD